MMKMRAFAAHAALIAGLTAAGWVAAADSTPPESKEAKLIAVLQSNAAPQDKAITCKQLAICGTKA
ncbi:MAG: hypothetical protein HGA47_15070, partial [Zoogloea sp.]|nr:hypothetical protein [Zoogloea sp.]